MSTLTWNTLRCVAFAVAVLLVTFVAAGVVSADDCAELTAGYAEARQRLQAAEEEVSGRETAWEAHHQEYLERQNPARAAKKNIFTRIEENVAKRALIGRLAGPDSAKQISEIDTQLARDRYQFDLLDELEGDLLSAWMNRNVELGAQRRAAEARRDAAREEVAKLRAKMGRGFGNESCFRTPRQERPAPAREPVAVLPVPRRDMPQDSGPGAGLPQSLPPIASTATCSEAKTALDQHKQAADAARGSGNARQFRFALDNVGAAMAMTQTICDREAATRPEPIVATPGNAPSKGRRTKNRQPRGGQPRGGQPTAVYPPAGVPTQQGVPPGPVYLPPRTKTAHPPRTSPKTVIRVQPKTIRRPPPINTRVARPPPNTRVVRPPVAQPRTVARPPAPARTTRCRYVKGSIPKCDTR